MPRDGEVHWAHSLELSTRAANILRESNVTMEQAMQMNKADWLSIRQCGGTTADELVRTLRDLQNPERRVESSRQRRILAQLQVMSLGLTMMQRGLTAIIKMVEDEI